MNKLGKIASYLHNVITKCWKVKFILCMQFTFLGHGCELSGRNVIIS